MSRPLGLSPQVGIAVGVLQHALWGFVTVSLDSALGFHPLVICRPFQNDSGNQRNSSTLAKRNNAVNKKVDGFPAPVHEPPPIEVDVRLYRSLRSKDRV
jgi:hypothetical protein